MAFSTPSIRSVVRFDRSNPAGFDLVGRSDPAVGRRRGASSYKGGRWCGDRALPSWERGCNILHVVFHDQLAGGELAHDVLKVSSSAWAGPVILALDYVLLARGP